MDLSDIKKILVIRTDRIGDVLLSTPALFNLRKSLPKAYIAMMVRPYARDIVEGNPNIDEVIIYDKRGKHKSWLSTIKFALTLRRKKIDLALILHPTNRVHIITFFAGIKRRIGYDRKFSFLLTEKVPEIKSKGEKHERDYALDMLKVLDLDVEPVLPFMPLRQESEDWAQSLFKGYGLDSNRDKLLALHPGASCPSKRWPLEYFAEVSQELIKKRGAKILVIGASEDEEKGKKLKMLIGSSYVFDLTGKTTLSQLASLLKRCKLFISNDSGPVHIASCLNTPVISIFGRNQTGLSPRRWGPLGKQDKIVHKEVGCKVCLAHNCNKDFLCLTSIKPEEIYQLAKPFL